MQINLIFDSSAQAAPQGFRDTIQAAANIIDATFSDQITTNIEVGYGMVTINGVQQDTLTGGDAETFNVNGRFYSYGTVRNRLAATVDSAAASGVQALPSGASINGHSSVVLWPAEAKALGLLSESSTALDGAVGFATDIPLSELTGVALHELTHALGRATSGDSAMDAFDFYRFTAAGQRLINDDIPQQQLSYFSLNGGSTALADYGQSSDPSDFLSLGGSLTPHDPFNEFYNNQTKQTLTSIDILQMEALGFHVQTAAAAPPTIFAETDLTFVNSKTGDWGFMTPSGTTEVWHAIGASSTAYTPVGSGDFNADGLRDVAFRNTATGDLGFMTPNTSGGETWHPMGATSTAYAAVAVGDFNGDSADDIAFVNTAAGDWGFMSASASGETWHAVGSSSTAYAVIGAASFDGSGTDSLVFRNIATGDWGYMTANASGGETWHAVGPSSTAYATIGIGDFNNDGVPDVAFRNTSTGDWGYMTPNTSGGETWHAVGTTSTTYAAVKVADFNGDGLADVAFRNPATGDWGYMTANLSGGGETWHPVGPTSTDYFAVA